MFGGRLFAALTGAFVVIRRSLTKALSRRGKESPSIGNRDAFLFLDIDVTLRPGCDARFEIASTAFDAPCIKCGGGESARTR